MMSLSSEMKPSLLAEGLNSNNSNSNNNGSSGSKVEDLLHKNGRSRLSLKL